MSIQTQLQPASQIGIAADDNNLNIHPIAGRIGAEIMGLDLGKKLGDRVVHEIRQALVKYKLTSPQVKKFTDEKYKGAVTAAF